MFRERRWRFPLGPLALLIAAPAWAACAEGTYPQSIFEPVTELGRNINSLQATIFWWTMLVLVVVLAALLYVLLRFRHREGAAEPPRIHGNNTLEILWTLGPAVIVALILVPTVRTIFDTYRPGPEGTLQVEAVGHQWWWEFRYPELGVITANQLHLPVGQPVQITLSSADVLHNFWIPRFAGKRYTYPVPRGAQSGSRENYGTLVFTVEQPGVYTGQCAEFCGEAHALMRMNVVATSAEEFDAWVEAMRAPGTPEGAQAPDTADAGAATDEPADTAEAGAATDEPADTADAGAATDEPADTADDPAAVGGAVDSLVQQGRQLFSRSACAACHAIEGVSQGRLGPNLTRFANRWAIAAGVLENTRENLELWIREPQTVKPGARMPGARTEGGGMPPTNLTDEQIRAIAAYLHSLR